MSKHFFVGSIIFIKFLLINYHGMAQGSEDQWVKCNDSGCKIFVSASETTGKHTWDGPCQDGKANGNGVHKYFIGDKLISTYTGGFKSGKQDGNGKIIFESDGTTYEGVFLEGSLTGAGKYALGNGDRYEGRFINQMPHGKGVTSYGNGKIFDGIHRNGVPYTGTFTNVDETQTFIHIGDTVSKPVSEQSSYSPRIGQEISEFFDEDWNRCEARKAKYYRRIKYKSDHTPEGKIKDYYMSGVLFSEYECLYVDYNDNDLNFRVNKKKWYYESGALKGVCDYGAFNMLTGIYVTYHENGSKQFEASMMDGMYHGVVKSWYANEKIKSMAFFEKNVLHKNKFVEYDENGNGCLVQMEHFDENAKKWTTDDKQSSSQVNEKGQLLAKVKIENGAFFEYEHFDIDQTGNYSIESSFIKTIGKGKEWYGVVFGHKDNENFYAFQISEFGYYTIWGEVEGLKINIREYFISSAIKKGNNWNQLKILKFGDYMTFYINGEMVEKLKASYFRGNNFGFLSYGKGEFLVNDLIVKQFVEPEDLEEAVPDEDAYGEWAGNGSGFFISNEGHIATNYHVIEDASEIQIEFNENGETKVFQAKVVASDKQNDLAIIKVIDPSFKLGPEIQYSINFNVIDVGTEVFTLGYPMLSVMGNEIKFTDGKISSKTGWQGDATTYQISVPVQPGNSGGPLFDKDGNLIGIIVSKIMKADNVSYAIKANYLKSLIESMTEKITIPNSQVLKSKNLTEKIKSLSDIVPVIKIR